MNKKYNLLIIIVLQLILCVIAFNKFFVAPNNYMFQNLHDGFKNYMTFQTYLSQPNKALATYTQMNYPFGEYIFYTDNSPLFAVSLKLFSNYVFDISPYSVAIYNSIIIFGYFFAAIILFFILKHFIQNKWLLVLFSVALTWLHPQMMRPFIGHQNLGLACLLLLTILGTLKITYATTKKEEKKWFILLTLTLISSSFVHLYYLLINVIFVGFWGFAWALDAFLKKENWKIILLKTWSIALGAVLFCFAVIRLIDKNYPYREVPKSYSGFSLNLKALFSSYDFNTIQPIKTINPLSPENYAYLGAAVVIGLLFLLISLAFRQFYVVKPHFKTFHLAQNSIIKYWLFASVMLTFIALGSTIRTEKMMFSNYFSLFFYTDLFTERFSQFRCLGRFSWFLFWIVNIAFAVLINDILTHSKNKFLKITVGFLLILLIIDTKDFVKHLNSIHFKNQFVEPIEIDKYKELAKNIDKTEFQAILPIPYFHLGTEKTNLTIAPYIRWLNSMGKLSYLTDLPLMASEMSRTAPYQAEALYTIFTDKKPSQTLLKRLNDKPILVVYSKTFNDGNINWLKNTDESMREVAINGKNIIEKYNMTLLHETDSYKLYRWDLQGF